MCATTKRLILAMYKGLVLLLIVALCYPVGYFVASPERQYTPHDASGGYSGVMVYLINLDRSPQRYDYVKDSINAIGLPFARISAVDGKTLTKEQIHDTVDMNSYREFMKSEPQSGTVGCSLSHIKAWKAFLDSAFEYALVAEDDITFDPIKLRATIENLKKINSYWDITSFELAHRGLPLTIKELASGQKLVVYLTEVTHTGAYIINRSAAQKLLEKALPIKMPIDHYFTRSWEFGLKFTGVENPRLVHQTFGASDINAEVQHEKLSLSIVERAHHALYKIQSSVIRFAYNLKIYFEQS